MTLLAVGPKDVSVCQIHILVLAACKCSQVGDRGTGIVQGIFKGSIVLNRDQIIAGMYHSSSRTIDSKGGGWKLKLPPTCCFCHLSNERIK